MIRTSAASPVVSVKVVVLQWVLDSAEEGPDVFKVVPYPRFLVDASEG